MFKITRNERYYLCISKENEDGFLTKSTLKDLIKSNQEVELSETTKTQIIRTIKSKIQFNKVVDDKLFFTHKKEFISNIEFLKYCNDKYNFNILPNGIKLVS